MKKLISEYLRLLARFKLWRTRPTVIGVTGSYGKTSTKEAIFRVLQTRWRSYRSAKSYNTDLGMCLTILEQKSGFRSAVSWGAILMRATLNSFFGRGYEYIVLEYGVDKPGDMDSLLAIVKPDIAVMTKIGLGHQAEGQFENEHEVLEEKKKLALAVGRRGKVVLNGGDELLKTIGAEIHGELHLFNDNELQAVEVRQERTGISGTIKSEEESVRAHFAIPGTHHMDVILAALLVGRLCRVSLQSGIEALQEFRLPPGRLSLIEGSGGSLILDSSYNASPETVIGTLQVLRDFPATRRIAVLGTMNELGKYSVEKHSEVGRACGDWLDMLIGVGEGGEVVAETSLKNGFAKANIKTFATAEEAGEFLKTVPLSQGDVVLVKGSQNKVRLERAVKIIMAHPEQAAALLCRQEAAWQEKI